MQDERISNEKKKDQESESTRKNRLESLFGWLVGFSRHVAKRERQA